MEHDITATDISSAATNIILVFLCISYYNVIELTFIIWGTFRRHSGLYFWSFVVATWGIPFYSGGFFVKYFAPKRLSMLAATLISVGWVAMVTGQSMVLWSRLHLVLLKRSWLKMVLWMIMTNAVFVHGITVALVLGASSSHPGPFEKPYSVMEKIQVTIFFLQEIIISGFYIAETVKMMKLERQMGNQKKSRRLMYHLVFVNAFIILLDMTILGLEYADQYDYQTSYKAFVYSVKLKLEFTILNRLVEMTTGNKEASSGAHSRTGGGNKTVTGIALDTFTSERSRKPKGDFAYEAYAMGGDERGSSANIVDAPDAGDNAVVMTTEVIVESEERGDDDARSISAKSSNSSTIDVGGYRRENLSKTSSEVHLAM